jgi:O-antigen/teichoic acid export membrane protein
MPLAQREVALLSAFQPFLQRPGVRAAISNFGWLAVERAVRVVLNLGVSFVMARYLGPLAWGELGFALAVIGVVGIMAEIGLEGVVRRDLIREPSDAIRLLATSRGLRIVGAGVSAVVLAAILTGGWIERDEWTLVVVLGLTLLQPAWLVPDMWFQTRLQARIAVKVQIGALLVGAILRLALVAAGSSLVGFAWATVVEAAVAGFLLWIAAQGVGLRLPWSAFDSGLAIRLLREAWPLFLSGFTVNLYMRVDAIMLRNLADASAVGIFTAATRFTEIWYFIPVALASSLLPALLRARARGRGEYLARLQAYYDLNAGLAYALAAPLALAAPWLVHIAYGPEFASASPVLALHVWSSVFVFLGVARSQFLVNEGLTRFYLAATAAGLVVNVMMNFILIPRHGAWGAAVSTVCGQAVAAWISSFCCTAVRSTAWMQTRALLIPFTWYRYVRHN